MQLVSHIKQARPISVQEPGIIRDSCMCFSLGKGWIEYQSEECRNTNMAWNSDMVSILRADPPPPGVYYLRGRGQRMLMWVDGHTRFWVGNPVCRLRCFINLHTCACIRLLCFCDMIVTTVLYIIHTPRVHDNRMWSLQNGNYFWNIPNTCGVI